MSPLGEPPPVSGEAGGEDERGCTYNPQVNTQNTQQRDNGRNPSTPGGGEGNQTRGCTYNQDLQGESNRDEDDIAKDTTLRLSENQAKDTPHTCSFVQNQRNTTKLVSTPKSINESGSGILDVIKVPAIHPIFLQKSIYTKNPIPGQKSTKQKPRRNSEQRTPGRKTLKDFFPIINQSTVTKQQHRVITLESDTHVMQRTTRQKSYKVTLKQYSKEQVISNESRRIITPGERTPRVRKSYQKRGKQSSTKICRSLQKEFHKAETKKSGRQSK